MACSSGMHAGLKTFKDEVFTRSADVRKSELLPQYRYLLVEQNGQEALLVWIGVEASPLGQAHVWISADGVIMRTVDGRLTGVTEPQRQWHLRSQSISPHPTSSVHVRLRQISDVQPGFRMGVDRLIEQKSVSSAHALGKWLDTPDQLFWLEEVDVANGERLAMYGLNSAEQTVAGQRCITPQWCIRWQSWPSKASSAKL